jgi:hypothetical protein
LNPFSRKTIALKLNYREGATYFFRDLRYHFLKVLLDDLEKNLSVTREQFRHFISWADESFQLLLAASDIPSQNKALEDFVKELTERTGNITNQIVDLQSLYKGRLQVEYRKNAIFFMHQLERIDFNNFIKGKRRHKKLYLARKELLADFPASWAEKATLDLNTIKSSALLYDYFGQVQQEIQAFIGRLRQFFTNEQEQPVDKLIESLLSLKTGQKDSKPPTLPEWEFNHESVVEKLRTTTDRLLSLVSVLPEESTVSVQFDGKAEGLTLPIRAMASHLTETTLTGPINDNLEELSTRIERSNLIFNDQASLVMFNLFNLEESDDERMRTDEIDKAVRSIHQEMELLNRAFEAAIKDIGRYCEDLQSALQIHHLTDLSGDFSTLVRIRRKRNLQGRLSAKLAQVKGVIHRAMVSVLYSQAKGVLLARELSASTPSLSVNERIVQVVRSVTPHQTILQKLPHYYVSLFSGRSNIGDNFWVPRPSEERQFEVGLDRYQVTRQGMLLVLGERNTGKTALSKHFTESRSAQYGAYHIFPPEDGATDVKVFEAALQKVTRIDGDGAQILSLLPHNSILVIHDLELWWERSAQEGLAVVRYLKSLIETFSTKCLFIVNTNPFAFSAINIAEPLDAHCAGVVRCLPFTSFDLKQLIMARHKSSGLSLDFGSGVNDTLGEIKLARLFNNLFTYSKGNPGVAMNAWLSGVQAFDDKVITWKAPAIKDREVLAEIPESWSHLCLQLLLHKRMNLDKIFRTVQLEKGQIISSLAIMNRLQLISVRGNSIYYLNPNVEFLLIEYIREREWI